MTKTKENFTPPTPREIETPSFDLSHKSEYRKNLNESIKKMYDLVFRKEASIELKDSPLGKPMALVWHQGKIIYSTEDPLDISDFKKFLNGEINTEDHLRKRQLKTLENSMESEYGSLREPDVDDSADEEE